MIYRYIDDDDGHYSYVAVVVVMLMVISSLRITLRIFDHFETFIAKDHILRVTFQDQRKLIVLIFLTKSKLITG